MLENLTKDYIGKFTFLSQSPSTSSAFKKEEEGRTGEKAKLNNGDTVFFPSVND